MTHRKRGRRRLAVVVTVTSLVAAIVTLGVIINNGYDDHQTAARQAAGRQVLAGVSGSPGPATAGHSRTASPGAKAPSRPVSPSGAAPSGDTPSYAASAAPSAAGSPPSAPAVPLGGALPPGVVPPGSAMPPPGPPLPPDPDGPDGSLEDTGNGSTALTFDDGPDPDNTPQVLALLRQYHITATFCLIGENVEAYPDLVRQIVADGHTVCNHSWDHDEDMASKTPDEIRADLSRASAAIEAEAPGAVIRYYRQPGGNWSPTIVEVARELGMSSLDWSVDPQDWTIPPVQTIEDTVLGQTGPGSIVLMHDGGGDRSNTIAALQVILPALSQMLRLEAMPTAPPAASLQRQRSREAPI